MGHIPEDENFKEYMNASADEWSKPEEPKPIPDLPVEPVDRWGSPIPQEGTINEGDRLGSEPLESVKGPAKPSYVTPTKKSGMKWWIIVIIVLAVLALCCLIVGGLIWLGLSLFRIDSQSSALIHWLAMI